VPEPKKRRVKQLSEIEHILLRGARYIGSTKLTNQSMFIYDDTKIIKKEVKYIPGLIKLVSEVIDNSVDEAIETNYQFANKIDIIIDDFINEITVKDNGRGIPVEKNADGVYDPELAWTSLRSGSNFDDSDDNKTIGQNGEGSSLVNIYSKSFIGETCDGKNRFTVVCNDNLSSKDITVVKGRVKGTKVSFIPDFDRFEVDHIDQTHKNIIYTRLINLSISHPDITFTFNGKELKFRKFSDYIQLYGDKFEVLEFDNLMIGLLPNVEDDFSFVHYINGINVYNGGSPLNWAVNSIINPVREKISKKYKTIKPGDIKNKLMFIVFFKNMINPRFDDQIKSLCNNSYAEFSGSLGDIDITKFITKVTKNSDLMDPIIEIFKIKEEYKKKQELKELQKEIQTNDIDDPLYLSATKRKKYLVLTEGDGAKGLISRVLGRDDFGYYPSKGKPLNAYDKPTIKILKNAFFANIMKILGLDIGKYAIPTYQNILIATDADADGMHIRGLLLAFFKKAFPKFLEDGRIKFLNTPAVILKQKKKIKEIFFNLNDFREYESKHNISNLEVKYYKGLGTWKDSDLNLLIDTYGIETFIGDFDYDEEASDYIHYWSSDAESFKRKELLAGNILDIDKI
jgi:DNA gyrase/topoisomerase IV subunit B